LQAAQLFDLKGKNQLFHRRRLALLLLLFFDIEDKEEVREPHAGAVPPCSASADPVVLSAMVQTTRRLHLRTP